MDSTGLYHFGARYYDPGIGRFTQRDPFGGGYVYGSDDPVNRLDPSGLEDFQPIPRLEEACGFGDSYDEEAISSGECVRYRNARVTGISDYYEFGDVRPVEHDFYRAVKPLARNTRGAARVGGCAVAVASGDPGQADRFCLGHGLDRLPYQ